MIDIIISKDMIPVLVTLFVLALVTLVTIAYVSRERFFIPVFIIIPTIFFCVYISWATISNLLGFPVATDIPDKSVYLAHVVNEEENVGIKYEERAGFVETKFQKEYDNA